MRTLDSLDIPKLARDIGVLAAARLTAGGSHPQVLRDGLTEGIASVVEETLAPLARLSGEVEPLPTEAGTRFLAAVQIQTLKVKFVHWEIVETVYEKTQVVYMSDGGPDGEIAVSPSEIVAWTALPPTPEV